ncbi:hypothetical protein C0995_013141 [Termitomyces sp. Mi166|nr:hypothetical protein C0995_013141 [Termitomyces sp. Mi166\
MATLPRAFRITPELTSSLFLRRVSEFDSGQNTSVAWTEHLSPGSEGESLPDEEPDHENEEDLRPARALYNFEGKIEFRELSVIAGDALEVVKEDLTEGWSLVKKMDGEVGLLPRTYHTTGSTGSVTPHGSPKSTSQPITLQNTGEWMSTFPSFRQRLLRGKTLNRFSSFVTSGAEKFVLEGTSADFIIEPLAISSEHRPQTNKAAIDEEEIDPLNQVGLGEADRHFVDAGLAWKEKIPPFRVLVHSPSKQTSTFSTPYIMYCVTSVFQPASVPEENPGEANEKADFDTVSDVPRASPIRLTVYRRFSHFVFLHAALGRCLPGIALPPLPEKQYAGRFSDNFIEARRGDLERYINKIVRHPVARYAEVVTFFLGCESEAEWDRLMPRLAMPAAGPAFYARVFHPAFNIDIEDAQEAVTRFEIHTRAVGKGVQDLRSIFGQVREARVEMSKAEHLLSCSLLSLITSKPLASSLTGVNEEDDEHDAKSKGLMNNDGAWCWRENCQGETDPTGNARIAERNGTSIPIVTTHKEALSRYKEATQGSLRSEEELAARCETVLNTTMAELETYHTQKIEDFSTFAKEHLDGEIQFYERILSRLYAARGNFDQPAYDELAGSPCQSSIYERELQNPRFGAQHLLQSYPHVFDSAPTRPVRVAIQEGVGMLMGPST